MLRISSKHSHMQTVHKKIYYVIIWSIEKIIKFHYDSYENNYFIK